MEPLFISVSDAAKALSLGKTSVYRLINQDKLKVLKFGRTTRVTTASIRSLADDSPT